MKREFKLKIKKIIARLNIKWFVAGGVGALFFLLFFGLIYAKTENRFEKLRKQDTSHSEEKISVSREPQGEKQEKGEEAIFISSSDSTYLDNTSSRNEQNESKANNSSSETEESNDFSSPSSSNTPSLDNNPDNNQNNSETSESSNIGGNNNSSYPTLIPTVISTPTLIPSPAYESASTPIPTPIPTATPTPTPTPNTVASETKEVMLFPASSATPNADGRLTITAQKYDHGYWDFVISGNFRFLQPQRLYQVWLCNIGCSSHSDAKFQTDESGNASLSGVVINHNQINNPVSSIKVWEIPPSGEIIEDPTTCYYISNDAKPCLESSIWF